MVSGMCQMVCGLFPLLQMHGPGYLLIQTCMSHITRYENCLEGIHLLEILYVCLVMSPYCTG